ncbi:MAG: hypothetical protein F6J96_13455 [Symploca sp. SIO1C2]|nr:hypothetical protein [Symploca sp. SIO1C2]
MTNQEMLAPALAQMQRSLATLEEQAATFTRSQIPVHLKMDLEDKRREVKELEARLRDGEPN